MAVALKIRIGDLAPKLLANALIILASLQPAGAVATGPLQALSNRLYDLFVLIQPHSHVASHLSSFIINGRKKTVNTALFFVAPCGILIPLDLEGKYYGIKRHLR
ncbi:MAG: hypothetical protein IJ977_08055 [Fibrobacter sp.]|nr:hypothetical protein [Fibrobacter sp.]